MSIEMNLFRPCAKSNFPQSVTFPRALSKEPLIRAVTPGHWYAWEMKVQGNPHAWAISAMEDLPSERTPRKDQITGCRLGFLVLLVCSPALVSYGFWILLNDFFFCINFDSPLLFFLSFSFF